MSMVVQTTVLNSISWTLKAPKSKRSSLRERRPEVCDRGIDPRDDEADHADGASDDYGGYDCMFDCLKSPVVADELFDEIHEGPPIEIQTGAILESQPQLACPTGLSTSTKVQNLRRSGEYRLEDPYRLNTGGIIQEAFRVAKECHPGSGLG